VFAQLAEYGGHDPGRVVVVVVTTGQALAFALHAWISGRRQDRLHPGR
jgi:hypothetical protein